MRVLIVTPLYPPEVADAALYTKELARRLSKNHEVTVVAYAHLPEEVYGVSVVTIDKRQPRFARLRAFRKTFVRAVKDADVVLAINGASVELPLLLTHFPKSVPLVYCIADATAHARAGLIERLAFARADAVVRELPPRRPEILPLEPEPTEALAAYEASWTTHLHMLESLFIHVS
jgi:hypothetical protein